MLKKLVAGLALGAAVVAVPATAFADSCANVSRPAPPCGTSCSTPILDGNWVWLPSLDALVGATLPPIWGFLPPGGPDAQIIGSPGAGGNYTNGQVEWLLGMSAICTKGVPSRQTSHGIQSGCGLG